MLATLTNVALLAQSNSSGGGIGALLGMLIYIAIIVSIDLAKSFGKSVLFAIGLVFLAPIFYCILGFGSAQYQGPAAANA